MLHCRHYFCRKDREIPEGTSASGVPRPAEVHHFNVPLRQGEAAPIRKTIHIAGRKSMLLFAA